MKIVFVPQAEDAHHASLSIVLSLFPVMLYQLFRLFKCSSLWLAVDLP